MKKTTILYLVSILAILISCKTNQSIKLPSMEGVKKMTITEVEVSERFGKASLGDTVLVSISTYDVDGKIQTKRIYDEDGISNDVSYTYKDSVVRVWTDRYLGSRSYPWVEEFTYNSDDKLVKRVRFDEGLIDQEEILEYDNKGNLIYTKVSTADNDILFNYEERITYEYDEVGRIASSVSTTQYASSKWEPSVLKKEYQYNDDGTTVIVGYGDAYNSRNVLDRYNNTIETAIISSEQDIAEARPFYYKHEYNKQNRIEKITTYDGERIIGYKFYEYEFYE